MKKNYSSIVQNNCAISGQMAINYWKKVPRSTEKDNILNP